MANFDPASNAALATEPPSLLSVWIKTVSSHARREAGVMEFNPVIP